MPRTTYRVDFYVSDTANDVQRIAVADYFHEIVDSGDVASGAFVIGEYGHYILGLHARDGMYGGSFVKLRRQDLPRIGDEKGNEEDIVLGEDQGLLEKNFFIYDPARNLLVWQLNNNGSHISRFATYLSSQMPNKTSLSPVIETDALERLMQGKLLLSEIDVSFAMPRNPAMFPTDATSKRFLELMQSLGANSIHIHASANAPGHGRGKHLYQRVKRSLQAIAGMQERGTRIVRATAEDTGETIDLIAERLVTEIHINVRGRYPEPRPMLNAMGHAIQEKEAELEDFFGYEDDRLE